jgi:hypothetical protein
MDYFGQHTKSTRNINESRQIELHQTKHSSQQRKQPVEQRLLTELKKYLLITPLIRG